MATANQVEKSIKKIEGFAVKLRWGKDNSDVNSKYSYLLPYPMTGQPTVSGLCKNG